jgi:hypothetical protein
MPALDINTTASWQSVGSLLFRSSVQAERVVGRDMPVRGLVLPERMLTLAEQATAINTLDELANMAANWDGYGALPIHPDTLSNAKLAVARLWKHVPAADITPNPHGTISFEWDSEYGTGYLELGKTRLSFYVKPRDGAITTLDGEASDLPQLADFILATVYPTRRNLASSSVSGVSFSNQRWY